MSVDWLIKLWDKGGAALVMIVLLFLLVRFVGKRGVTALDNMTKAQGDSAKEIANTVTTSVVKIADAVQSSTAAQVIALGQLTERVARVEGKVETIGMLAVQAAKDAVDAIPLQSRQHARTVAVASAVEVFDADESTPVHAQFPLPPEAVPIPVPDRVTTPRVQTRPIGSRVATPARGTAYSSHPRPGTKGGDK